MPAKPPTGASSCKPCCCTASAPDRPMSIRNLDRLLDPRSIAVIGASDRVGSVGATVWRNVRAGHFGGRTYAVNHKRSTVCGEPAFARVADLPQAPDLALICTPPHTVAALVADLATRGTLAAIVMTAGLTAAQQQAALHAARAKPVIVVKAGRAGNGVKAAASHTGALAGSDVVIDAAIRRAGMLRVDTLQELFMAAETLARFRGDCDGGLTIMTNGGGAGV